MIDRFLAPFALGSMMLLGKALAFTTVSPSLTATNIIAKRRIQSDSIASNDVIILFSAPTTSDPTTTDRSATQKIPLFDFSDPALKATNKFERIDDVIMGGISSSLLRQADGEKFARWSGVCRTDGGYVTLFLKCYVSVYCSHFYSPYLTYTFHLLD